MANPLVTVIVTTFNRCDLLNETLDSILSQTFSDFELLIVDNMSIDATSEWIANRNDKRIKYFRNANHGVIAVNRNFGIQHASGKYIAFCDDDDLWMPDKLALQIKLLETHPELALCYSQATAFKSNLILKERMVRRSVTYAHFYNLLQGNYIPNSSVLVRKVIFDVLGLLNESAELREDYEMWLRITNTFKIQGIDQPLIKYRVHLNNNAGSKVAETKRAIRTLLSVMHILDIPLYLYFPALCIQCLKYVFYKFTFSSTRIFNST